MSACRLFLVAAATIALAAPAAAQELPDEGQSEAAYHSFRAAKPAFAAQVDAFEEWLRAKRVHNVLPTWQILRTATMWSECAGPPFEVPPKKLWPNVAATLRFVRDHVSRSLGAVQAVSAYRNPVLNVCARGSRTSAHRDYSALDLVPAKPLNRRQIFNAMCLLHRGKGPASGVGLGFYAFTRFHVDTRSFRRWGSAGPLGNESPCAVLERGGDPEAPPLPPPEPAPDPTPDQRPPLLPHPEASPSPPKFRSFPPDNRNCAQLSTEQVELIEEYRVSRKKSPI